MTFEVGIQDDGMALGLVATAVKGPAAPLAPVIFGTFMSETGSALASWRRDRPLSLDQ